MHVGRMDAFASVSVASTPHLHPEVVIAIPIAAHTISTLVLAITAC